MRLLTRSIVALAFIVSACQQEEVVLDSEVVSAYDTFVQAIRTHDAISLYELSPGELRARFDALYAELNGIIARIEREYPAVDRADALQALAADTVRKAKNGRELFVALVNVQGIEESEAIRSGLQVATTSVDGDKAIVTTRGGEAFHFERDRGKWRCTTLVEQLDSYASLSTLRTNMMTAASNLDVWLKARRETVDPTRPEGAANIILQAIRRGRRVTVFERLDDASKKHLADGAAAVKELLAALERRFPTKDERTRFLSDQKLGHLEKVADAKSLFAALWDAGLLASDLPSGKGTTVKSVTEGERGVTTVVTTGPEGESTTQLVKGKDGQWQLASLEPVLDREAVVRIRQAIGAVPVPAIAPDATGP